MFSYDVGVIGLGKLGLPLAINLARVSQKVIGIDLDNDVIDQVNANISPYLEPGVHDALGEYEVSSRLVASNSLYDLATVDIVFVIVPTPSKEDGTFSTMYLEKPLRELANIWQQDTTSNQTKFVVIVSTVMPGDTDRLHRDFTAICKNRDVRFYYSPEFIALGSVMHDMQNPDLILFGSNSLDTTDRAILQVLINMTNDRDVPVKNMTNVEAELTKIAINTFLTLKISYANMIGMLAVALQADPKRVLAAVASDSRVGNKYMQYGPPFSGPCLPRDTVALGALLESYAMPSSMPKAAERINTLRKNVLNTTFSNVNGSIGIYGVSYKPNTDVLTESMGIAAMRELIHDMRRVVHVYDPNVKAVDLEKAVDSNHFIMYDNLFEFIQASSTIFMTHKDLAAQKSFEKSHRQIISCWD